jgi:hypothetical protein
LSSYERERRKTIRPAPNRKKKPKDERTKFDKWLDRMREDRSPVHIHFAIPPSPAYDVDLGAVVHVIDVDRYFILVEFEDAETWWVSKSIITSAAISEETELQKQLRLSLKQAREKQRRQAEEAKALKG